MKPSSRQSVNFCRKCKSRLESYGQPAFNIMDSVCYFFMESVPVFIDSDHEQTWSQTGPIIGYLEAKGYLMSTEVDAVVLALVPTGELVDKGVCKEFCWCKTME